MKKFFLSDSHARRDEQRLKKLDKDLASIYKYITPQRSVIDKNKGSRGWALGFTSAFGARKAMRKRAKR